MFKVSAKSIYGLSAVLELAMHYGNSVLQIRDIARVQDIPQHYLEQILIVLKRGGIVKSVRGAQGGYALARAPHSITLLEIFTLLEGPLENLNDKRGDYRLNSFWQGLADSLRKPLQISLETLLDDIRNAESPLNYVI